MSVIEMMMMHKHVFYHDESLKESIFVVFSPFLDRAFGSSVHPKDEASVGGSASVGTALFLGKSQPDSGESLCADSVFPEVAS